MNRGLARCHTFQRLCLVLLALVLSATVWGRPADPVVEGRWIRPSFSNPALPVWGHVDGLRIGLWPMAGPRGLLRVYAPYLGHADDRMINYLAVEPIVTGENQRGFSELEQSSLDGVEGLRIWSTDQPDDVSPREPTAPARGTITHEDGVERLIVYCVVEPFRSGAAVMLRLEFRSDRSHEVGVASFLQPGSASLRTCIITATMGNYARLRILHLRTGSHHAVDLWSEDPGLGFTPHACFPLRNMLRTPSGGALFLAMPDESDPGSATYAAGTFLGWKYSGEVATQYWRHEDPSPNLIGCVNARSAYWASSSPIPGGLSFENFELVEPFCEGTTVWFGVRPGLWHPESLLAPSDTDDP